VRVWIFQPKSLGQVLFDAVIGKLQLVEYDYFDLEFLDPESVPVSFYMHTWLPTLLLTLYLFFSQTILSFDPQTLCYIYVVPVIERYENKSRIQSWSQSDCPKLLYLKKLHVYTV